MISNLPFINNFKCYQCGVKPLINSEGYSTACQCGRCTVSDYAASQALLFNCSLEYVWTLIFYKKEQPIITFILSTNKTNKFLTGPQGLFATIAGRGSPATVIQILQLNYIPDFIKQDWQSMLNHIEQLAVFA